jgi:hypothetical protein
MGWPEHGQHLQEPLEGQLAGAVLLQQVQQAAARVGDLLAEGVRRGEFGQRPTLGRAGVVLGEHGDLLLGRGVLQLHEVGQQAAQGEGPVDGQGVAAAAAGAQPDGAVQVEAEPVGDPPDGNWAATYQGLYELQNATERTLP